MHILKRKWEIFSRGRLGEDSLSSSGFATIVVCISQDILSSTAPHGLNSNGVDESIYRVLVRETF